MWTPSDAHAPHSTAYEAEAANETIAARTQANEAPAIISNGFRRRPVVVLIARTATQRSKPAEDSVNR
jgi:hypothetical protein